MHEEEDDNDDDDDDVTDDEMKSDGYRQRFFVWVVVVGRKGEKGRLRFIFQGVGGGIEIWVWEEGKKGRDDLCIGG